MNKSPSNRLLLFLPLGACLLAGCISSGSLTLFEYSLAETYSLPASGMVHLTSEDADVTISGSDRDDVRIEARYVVSAPAEQIKRFTYRLNVVEANGDMVVAEARQTGTRNFVHEKQIHTISIELPRTAHVTIREEDGTCTIRGVDGRVHLTMDDGAIRLENCTGDITVSADNARLSQSNCAALKFEPR